MVSALATIDIYANSSVLGVGGHLDYIDSDYHSFPVTDSCERSATLMGDEYIKLTFNLPKKIVMPAFCFVFYDGQLYFLKEEYRPTPKGTYYAYDVKFVSMSNMLSKPICYRHVVVVGTQTTETFDEPEISVIGTLSDMSTLVLDSIHVAGLRYTGLFRTLLTNLTLSQSMPTDTDMLSFSYDSATITDVLADIAAKYEIEWWLETTGTLATGVSIVLHFSKCERTDIDMLNVSDTFEKVSGLTKSKGLLGIEYTNEWSNIAQRLTPFGSDRNMTRRQAVVNDMYVSYGTKLRLDYNHTCTIGGVVYNHAYKVTDTDGSDVAMFVDSNGAITVSGVTTGIEKTESYDDVYPRCHFRVMHVKQKGTDNPIYTIYGRAINAQGQVVDLPALFPIDIADGQTLSVTFEKGLLNGRSFEVADKSAKLNTSTFEVDPNGVWFAVLEIVPEGDNVESPQIPFGNFIPHGADEALQDGDEFAIFNMVMPQAYVTAAQEELAQKAFDTIREELATRPEIKCTGDPEFFMNKSVFFGLRVSVTSELFGENAVTGGGVFVSRVTNYSHSLTKPYAVTFKLASSQVEGTIAALEAAIADHTSTIQGVEQSAQNLSRRAFRDTNEMKEMLSSLASAMMVVGVDRYQFSFTLGISIVSGRLVSGVDHFNYLNVTAGAIQHTQEPYISYPCAGLYQVSAQPQLHHDVGSVDINSTTPITVGSEQYVPYLEPYYVFAKVDNTNGTASVCLVSKTVEASLPDGSKYLENEDFLLLGVLSSEFEDGSTSYRIFNRTNGYTQIAGGTITTEQIQDPTRSLVIDMASNPPRLIASRGAQIIGNITFLSATDANGVDISNVGTDVDKAMTEARKTICGENLLYGSNVFLSQSSNYSATPVFKPLDDVNIEELNRNINENAVLSMYVKCSSARFNYLGASAYGVSVELVFSRSGYSDVTLQLSKYTSQSATLRTEEGRISKVITIPNLVGYTLTSAVMYIKGLASGSVTIGPPMLQIGEKMTEYKADVKYLVEAFESNARSGSTTIDGGLMFTSLIQLKDPVSHSVTAGLSGIQTYQGQNDPVLLWGGGTYAQALANQVAVLITKTGVDSRIGCFKIKSDKVIVETSQGTVVIDDTDGIKMFGQGQQLTDLPKVEIRPYPISLTELPARKDWEDDIPSSGSFQRDTTIPWIVRATVANLQFATQATRRLYYKIKFRVYFKLNVPSTWGPNDYPQDVVITIGSKTYYYSVVLSRTSSANVFEGWGDYQTNDYLDPTSNVQIKIVATGSTGIGLVDCSWNTWTSWCYDVQFKKTTVIGTNGIMTSVNSEKYFYVNNDEGLDVRVKGLPTSDPGVDGELWNDNGTIKIS